MTRKKIYIALIAISVFACIGIFKKINFITLPGSQIDVIEVKELKFIDKNTYFAFGDFNHKELQRFIKKENLYNLWREDTGDLEKVLRVKEWVRKHLKVSLSHCNYPPWQAWVIMDMVRKQKIHVACVEYSVVLSQILMGLGMPTRYIILHSPDVGPHYVVEIWSTKFNKWIMCDVRMNRYFERNGIPLNILELHEALVSGQWSDITITKNKSGKAKVVAGDLKDFKEFDLILRNDHITRPLTFYKKILNFDNKISIVTRWDDQILKYTGPADNEFFSWVPDLCTIKIKNKDLQHSILDLEFDTLINPTNKYLVYDGTYSEFSGKEYRWNLKKGYNRLTVFPWRENNGGNYDTQSYIAVSVNSTEGE